MHLITCATVSCRTPSAAAPGDVSEARLELVCSTALASTVESMAVLRGRSSRQKDALLLTFRQAHEAGWLMPSTWPLKATRTLNWRRRLQPWDGVISVSAIWGGRCVSSRMVQGAAADLQASTCSWLGDAQQSPNFTGSRTLSTTGNRCRREICCLWQGQYRHVLSSVGGDALRVQQPD